MKFVKYLGVIISTIAIITILKALNRFDFVSFVAGELYVFLIAMVGIYESK